MQAEYRTRLCAGDARGLTRILDARAVLSPYVGLRRTLEILRAYRVDAVVLNARFDRPVATDYWSTRPADEAATRAKFESRPDLFRPVFVCLRPDRLRAHRCPAAAGGPDAAIRAPDCARG